MGATSRSLLGQAIIPEPATAADNVIQPLVDSVPALVVKAHSPTQAAGLIVMQDSLGAATGTIGPDLSIGASGELIGFLGATLVARQVNGAAADLAAIADAPAKAFLTALSTALVNLGLVDAPV